MRISLDKYYDFHEWYIQECRYGLNSFPFPKIDGMDKTNLVEYRFASGSSPSYSNVSGDVIDVTMKWEEV